MDKYNLIIELIDRNGKPPKSYRIFNIGFVPINLGNQYGLECWRYRYQSRRLTQPTAFKYHAEPTNN